MPIDTPSKTLLTRLLASRPLAELRLLRSELLAEVDATRGVLLRLQAEIAEVEHALAERSDEPERVEREPSTNGRRRNAIPLKKAIVMLLRERPGPWTRNEIMDELTRRGLEPGGNNPNNTLISRLSELANEKNGIERMGDGFGIPPRDFVPRNVEEVPAM